MRFQSAEAGPVLPPGPDTRVRVTERYARMVARDAYFFAWPLLNMYNRRLALREALEPALLNGLLPVAPLNRLAMLHDYLAPEQRWVACPNQDAVYGSAMLALDETPVVVQVPDFGRRFWVYQALDLRTDSFARLGSMYETPPGFYLIVGPDWIGEAPPGIAQVFRCSSRTALVAPRVFQDDTEADKREVRRVIEGIDAYPLADFDGVMKRRDWTRLPVLNRPDYATSDEASWVFPESFFDQLPKVLRDAPALPGEEALYAQIFAVLEASRRDPALRAAMVEEAVKAEAELISPLLHFRNWGLPLANNWTSMANGAAFGTDYFTRTAVARSNILVNTPRETKYLYQDLDESGARLNGDNCYVVTFLAGQTPPSEGFWSLTLYDDHHFLVPNAIGRYSIGSKNKGLQYGRDGSLTVLIQASPPKDRRNWLPAPSGGDFSLFIRAYWPKAALLNGSWAPPAVQRVN